MLEFPQKKEFLKDESEQDPGQFYCNAKAIFLA